MDYEKMWEQLKAILENMSDNALSDDYIIAYEDALDVMYNLEMKEQPDKYIEVGA